MFGAERKGGFSQSCGMADQSIIKDMGGTGETIQGLGQRCISCFFFCDAFLFILVDVVGRYVHMYMMYISSHMNTWNTNNQFH